MAVEVQNAQPAPWSQGRALGQPCYHPVMCTRVQSKWASLTVAVAVLAVGCRQASQDEVAENQSNTVVQLPRLPVAEPPMDRAALLMEVAKAASASALGKDISNDLRKLDGKRFEVRIRFGCAPPAAPPKGAKIMKTSAEGKVASPFTVRFDQKDRTLRLRAAPDLTLNDRWVASLVDESVEAVEGFWMYRPWLLTDGCPVLPAQVGAGVSDEEPTTETKEAAAPIAQSERKYRVGLAQFFTKSDTRTGRRDGRPYETTKTLAADKQPSRQGYNLVLSGRLRHLPSGQVIACRLEGANSPPQCLISAQFDRVWIEEPETRDLIAEWGN